MSQRAEHSLWSRVTEGCVFSNLLCHLVRICTLPSEDFKAFFSVSVQPVPMGPRGKVSLLQCYFLQLPHSPQLCLQYRLWGKGNRCWQLTGVWFISWMMGRPIIQGGRGLFPQVGRDIAIMVNAIRCLEKSNHMSAESLGSCCGTWAASLFPERLRDAAMMKKPWS